MQHANASISKHVLGALKHIEVLNNIDICQLDEAGLTENARLVAMLARRLKRLCAYKADNVAFTNKMREDSLKAMQLLAAAGNQFASTQSR